MNKIFVIIAIIAGASAIYVWLPGLLEHANHYMHYLAVIVSTHHIADEVAHAIHPRERRI